jgi:hypothetical protein
MRVILLSKQLPRGSRHGGTYIRCVFMNLETLAKYKLDVYDQHSGSKRWLPYLKEQAIFDNVSLHSPGFIDGNSNFTFIGIKGQS